MKIKQQLSSLFGSALFVMMLTPAAAKEVGQVTPPHSASDVHEPVAGAPLSPQYVSAIGRMAYIWGWPLVNMHNRQTLFATAPEPGLLGGVLPVAPLNQLSMLSDYLRPEQRFVTSPNQDVVYGAGFLALDQDAVVVQVPDFGDRFWVYQVVDQRSDSFAAMGIQYQTEPGLYLLVGSGRDGRVRCPMAFRQSIAHRPI